MIAAALLLAIAAPAEAAPAEPLEPAVRCAIVTGLILQNPDKAIAQAGLLAAMYWFGRIDLRVPDAELEALMAQEAQRMTVADVELEAKRCGEEMQVRGQVMTDIGASLERREARRQTR